MRCLWLKQRYVLPTVTGEKRQTVRKSSYGLERGDRIRFSVGPRSPFAEAVVTRVDRLTSGEAPAEAVDLLGDLDVFYRIHFAVVVVHVDVPEVDRALGAPAVA